MTDLRIMFMGTPDIARTTLDTLLKDGHNIVAVVTREDKPRGRGNVMTPTPVKMLATEHGIPTYTPSTLSDDGFMAILDEYKPELIVVVAYGKILPARVLDYPKHGCINLHVSLLPAYRGAAPIQRAIMEGERVTGVSVMYMDVGLDTGDVIDTYEIPISITDTSEDIHDRAALDGSRLLSEVIVRIGEGRAERTPQDHTKATYAAKIEREDAKIDFNMNAALAQCRIRGVTPFPGAFCMHGGRMLKITACLPLDKTSGAVPGTVIDVSGVGEGYIDVAFAEGTLRITRLKPEGKGVMSAGDFVRGRKIEKGEILA